MGTAALAFAKAVENMEISHNVGHGQWDWMNDPEIHSTTWEWDMVGLSSQWRYSHDYRHHVFTNVLEMDDDLAFGVMRLSRDQPWRPRYLVQPLRNLLLAILLNGTSPCTASTPRRTAPRRRESRPTAGVRERKPVLSDRAPSVPRPAQ